MNGDLISRKALIEKMFPYGMPDNGNYGINARAVMKAVMEAAAVEAEPVVCCWNPEKLDKVIAGLKGCVACICSNCEYFDHESSTACTERLMVDALEVIGDLSKDKETLHRINEDWRSEVARLHERIDEARVVGAKLSEVAVACEKPRTRYEWIRSLSPMQMVNWIYHMKTVCDCCDRQYVCGVPDDEVTEEYCLEHILLWLGREVSE